MFVKIHSTSKVRDAGDMFLNMEKVVGIVAKKVEKNDQDIYVIALDVGPDHFKEVHDTSSKARERMAYFLTLLGKSQEEADEMVKDYDFSL